jgi:hypothetical protein
LTRRPRHDFFFPCPMQPTHSLAYDSSGGIILLLTRSRAYTRRLRDDNLAGGAQRAGLRQCTADAIGEDGGERSIHGWAPRSSHPSSASKPSLQASKSLDVPKKVQGAARACMPRARLKRHSGELKQGPWQGETSKPDPLPRGASDTSGYGGD